MSARLLFRFTMHPMAEGQEGLLNDPLFLRLREIRREVEAGRADPKTVERWEELRETVAAIMDDLRATLFAALPTDREQAAREWIQSFVDEHRSRTTAH